LKYSSRNTFTVQSTLVYRKPIDGRNLGWLYISSSIYILPPLHYYGVWGGCWTIESLKCNL